MAAVQSKEGTGWGLIDATGREIVPLVYDSVQSFEDGIAQLIKGNTSTFIDREGEVLFELVDKVVGPFSEGRAWIREKQGDTRPYGFIDRQGTIVIPYQYPRIRGRKRSAFSKADLQAVYGRGFSEGLIAVSEEKNDGPLLWRYIDRQGRPAPGLGEKTFGHGGPFINGLALVSELRRADDERLDERWGYIDRAGEWVYGPADIDWSSDVFEYSVPVEVCVDPATDADDHQ